MNIKYQLLHENKNALRFLHDADGFDFEAPHIITAIDGRFTRRTILAAVPAGYVIRLLVKPAETHYRNRVLIYVRVNYCGDFEARRIDGVSYWGYRTDDGYDIDYMFGKGDFENLRKNETDRVFIIAQDPEYLKPRQKPVDDWGARFNYRDCRYTGDGRGNRWISEIHLTTRDGAARHVAYSTGANYRHEPRTDKPGELIDKSGYIVHERRADLKRRAAALRAERARIAAAAADFTGELNAAENALHAVKIQLAEYVLNATTHNDFNNVERAARNLYFACMYFEKFRNKQQNGGFSSIDNAKSYLNYVVEYSGKAAAEMGGNDNE